MRSRSAVPMQIRARDLLWAVVAVAAVLGGLWALASVFRGITTLPSMGRMIGVLLTVVLVGAVTWWIAAGAWLRTRWGAPSGGVREAAEAKGRRGVHHAVGPDGDPESTDGQR